MHYLYLSSHLSSQIKLKTTLIYYSKDIIYAIRGRWQDLWMQVCDSQIQKENAYQSTTVKSKLASLT